VNHRRFYEEIENKAKQQKQQGDSFHLADEERAAAIVDRRRDVRAGRRAPAPIALLARVERHAEVERVQREAPFLREIEKKTPLLFKPGFPVLFVPSLSGQIHCVLIHQKTT
jgi:hypothetical protein